jgi:hypothetical protein
VKRTPAAAETAHRNGAARANGRATSNSNTRVPTSPPRRTSTALARPEAPASTQMVVAAGSAIVTAARVGRLLGRSSWRIAKQLPGVGVVEQQAQKLRQAAAHEMMRLLDMPQNLFGSASPEEQRVMMLVRNAESDPEPLRTAMSELLERSADANGAKSRDYLFGTIVSQLVPDEARIIAVLAERPRFAAVDVVAKQVGRSSTRMVAANLSNVGDAAGIALPHNAGTYLARLLSFGLIEFGTCIEDLDDQFETLLGEQDVVAAKVQIENEKLGSIKIVRKSVALTNLGRDFWVACAPTRRSLTRPAG